ncbi:MAG: hypothetical protein FJX57_01080, partial [Alphaproteobacteria bacterium]|nr:hypothetical protein [Alphaproteobacteria bacterium]
MPRDDDIEPARGIALLACEQDRCFGDRASNGGIDRRRRLAQMLERVDPPRAGGGLPCRPQTICRRTHRHGQLLMCAVARDEIEEDVRERGARHVGRRLAVEQVGVEARPLSRPAVEQAADQRMLVEHRKRISRLPSVGWASARIESDRGEEIGDTLAQRLGAPGKHLGERLDDGAHREAHRQEKQGDADRGVEPGSEIHDQPPSSRRPASAPPSQVATRRLVDEPAVIRRRVELPSRPDLSAMQHATFLGSGRIRIDDAPPPVPASGEMLLRVAACALCGSDLRPLRQGWPMTPGHEIVGRVDRPGHRLHGRRSLVYIPSYCGACESCTSGDTHVCATMPALIGWQRPGGYAEAVVVPEQCLLPVPDDIPTELAPLLLDTIGTAGHGVRLARRIVESGAALVIGAGPIGLGAIMVLRRLGFAPVHVAEPQVHRRDFAASLGADPVDLASLGRTYPVVIEATGKDSARQAALEAVRPRGAVIQLGESDAWAIAETKPIRRKDFYYIRSFYFPRGEFEENVAL